MPTPSDVFCRLNRWFLPDQLPEIRRTLDILPRSATKRITDLLHDPECPSFEAVFPDRLALSVLRVLTRILSFGPCNIVTRASLELTHRCNSRCTYCKTQSRVEESDYPEMGMKKAFTVIDALKHYGCRFLHLTGGEISLLDWVPVLVRRSTDHGMTVTASSNGSGEVDFYRRLVESGLSGLHISLDSCLPKDFMAITRGQLNLQTIMSNLSFLCNEGKKMNSRLSVIANVVLNEFSLPALPETVAHLLQLGVDDIKLMLQMGNIHHLDKLKELFLSDIRPSIKGLLPKNRQYPLLEKRTDALFDRGTHGIDMGDPQSTFLSTCELSMDCFDIRADGQFAPCFIYMREKYTEQSYGFGDLDHGVESYFTYNYNMLRDIYANEIVCQHFCPDFIQAGNRCIAVTVFDCLKELFADMGSQRRPTGKTQVTYNSLEMPYSPAPLVSTDSLPVLLLPVAFFDSMAWVPELLSKYYIDFEEKILFDMLPNFMPGTQALRLKIFHNFSKTNGGYRAFVMRLPYRDVLYRIIDEIDKKATTRVINIKLRQGKKVAEHFNIAVSPFAFLNVDSDILLYFEEVFMKRLRADENPSQHGSAPDRYSATLHTCW